ncbi:MAG: acyltransferase family protein [Aquabacterium sp.]
MSAVHYRPEVDGLRSIAVLAVMLYHAGFSIARGGFVGVDVFFVISGYLITGIIYPEVRAGQFSFIRFYERRVRRIFPALFVMVAVTTMAGLVLMTPAQLKDHGQAVAAVGAFLSNLYFLVKTGYFSRHADEVPLLHTWSLAVEEQFYVLFPVALLAAWRLARGRIAMLLAAAFVLSLALCLWRLHRGNDVLNFFEASSRAWELLIGAWLAVRQHDGARPLVAGPARRPLGWLGLALVVGPVVAFQPGPQHPGLWTLIPVAGTALLLAAAGAQQGVGRLLATAPFVRVGLISYSAYLWHQPLFALTTVARGEHAGADLSVALLLLCLGIAWVSWRYIEAPFRDRTRTSRRMVWVGAAIGTVLCLVGGVGLHLTGGLPQRYSDEQVHLMSTAVRSPLRDSCHFEAERPWPEQACQYPAGAAASWAVLGDSHNVELGWALSQRLSARGDGGLLHLSASGCQPALDFVSNVPSCQAWLRRALAVLESRADITHVVLLWRHSFYLHGDTRQHWPALPDDPPIFMRDQPAAQAREAYVRSLNTVVQRLLAARKTVLLLDPVPELGRPVEYHVFSRALPPAARADGPDRAFYQRRHAHILSALAAVPSHPLLVRVPSADAVCTGPRCLALVDGQSLYFDDNHLSLSGAARLADLVLARAAAAQVAARDNRP